MNNLIGILMVIGLGFELAALMILIIQMMKG